MSRLFIVLISLLFLAYGSAAQAQDAQIRLSLTLPKKAQKTIQRDLPREMWDIQNGAIRSNLEGRLNTLPLIHTEKFDLELGPGQILIRFPI